jgi:hypothetical protein
VTSASGRGVFEAPSTVLPSVSILPSLRCSTSTGYWRNNINQASRTEGIQCGRSPVFSMSPTLDIMNPEQADLMCLGDHCEVMDCHQIDFLPFQCDACRKVFKHMEYYVQASRRTSSLGTLHAYMEVSWQSYIWFWEVVFFPKLTSRLMHRSSAYNTESTRIISAGRVGSARQQPLFAPCARRPLKLLTVKIPTQHSHGTQLRCASKHGQHKNFII